MTYPSVVKIYTTAQDPDYDSPWQSQNLYHGTGSGVVISGGKILTAAHVVANQTFIQVQKASQPDKVRAEVYAVSHECDLALVMIRDPEFLVDLEPMRVGELPNLRDKVTVVGYPIGGEEISITEGVVSRVELQHYTHSQRKLVAVTVDAAINSGNSGGPVFRKGQVVGIAFQSRTDGENIGEIVPTPVIHHFLDGVQRGNYLGFPGLGISYQTLENPVLRKHLGVGRGKHGVLVNEVHFANSAWGVLEAGDVLVEVDGQRISNNGTVIYAGRYRTSFESLLQDKVVGGSLAVKVIRDKKPLELEISLMPLTHLVPRSRYDVTPSYYVYGGLVFQPLSRDYLETWNKWRHKAPKEFVHLYYHGVPTEARQEVVVLSQVLADEINVGYDEFTEECIARINGVQPKTLAECVSLLDAASGLVEILTSLGNLLVLDAKDSRAAMPEILSRYRIPADRSADLLSV